ncbi:MAG: tungsten cofactor oxidoreductase radical SAM maturase [Peptococcaceae bacterium]|nr:tungsten cofactor oxidoreductase radical SAM maturase [Peptococcaceae bacterium]
MEALGTTIFAAGEKIKIAKDGCAVLPVASGSEQEALFIQTENGYRVIPLEPDVKKIYVEATTLCNFSCITCIRNSWRDELSHMKWSTFEKILDSLKELPDLETVHFGGFGEPLSHPNIFDMIKAVKDLNLKVEMITNGSLLTEYVIKELIGLELDVIYVSLDGPDEEEYNKIRQGADFNNVFGNILNLNRMKKKFGVLKPELGIEFVAMKKNFHKLPKLLRLAWEMKVRTVIVTNVLPYHESLKDEILYDMDDTGNLFGNESWLLMLQAQMPYMKLRTDRYCKFVEDKTMSVNFKGDVSPCYALMHSYRCFIYGREKEIKPCYLGNVEEKTLKEIWTDPGYINFRLAVKNFRFPSCTDCKFLEGCTMADDNEMDCWGNSPSCAECLWSRRIVACP